MTTAVSPTEIRANAKVSAKVQLTPDLMILQIKPEGWQLSDFKPGQFCTLGLPETAPRVAWSDQEPGQKAPNKWIKRAYSIASSSVEKNYLEFYVALVHSGALSPRLFELKPGDPIYMGPKIVGIFTFDKVPKDKSIVMIATGTGVAPYMSMIRTFLDHEKERKFVLIQGARHSWDLGYYAELNRLASQKNNFIYHPVLSRPDGESSHWGGDKGHVQSVWNHPDFTKEAGLAFSPDNSHIFLCGNPRMIEDMVNILNSQGFKENKPRDTGQVHLERYW